MEALENLGRLLEAQGADRLKRIGMIASAAWLALVLLAAWLTPGTQDDGGLLAWLVWLVGVVVPLVLIWLAVHSAQTLVHLRAEADGLRAALGQIHPDEDAPRLATAAPAPAPAAAPQPAPRRPMPAPPRPAAQPAVQSAVPPVTHPVEPTAPEEQDAVHLSPTELYFALNFPEGPQDHEAIRCLQLALADAELSRLIRAAQDVITLLAGQGIYMDDLTVPETDPALWQRFSQGVRGTGVSGLAVIDNTAALERTSSILRDDEVFRDVAHHFMRRFDRLLTLRGQSDDPTVLAVLSETRSGRAFILLAQVSGMLGDDGTSAPAPQPSGDSD